MFKNLKISVIANWIILGLVIITCLDYAYSAYEMFPLDMQTIYVKWLDMHQHFYIAALLLALLGLFFPKHLPLMALISIAASPTLFEMDLFDEIIHSFFIRSGFYQLLGSPHFGANPQYSKLVFYFFFIAIYPILFLLKKPRRINWIFIWILLLVNLMVVGIQHRVLPSGILKKIAYVEIEKINMVQDMNLAKLAETCDFNSWNCRVRNDKGIKEINAVEMDTEASYFQNLSSNLMITKTDFTAVDLNGNPSIYRIVPVKENVYYEIFESKKMKLFWSVSLGYLSEACFIVSALWFFFLVFLSEIHKRVKLR